jgi:hypothetical protein
LGAQKPTLFRKGHLDEALYYGANDADSINETPIKNDITLSGASFVK